MSASKHTFTPRATDYLIDPEHPESIHGATYRALPCGCEVIGNGTLPAPLTVKQCAQCAAASLMVDTLEKIELLESGLMAAPDQRPIGETVRELARTALDAACPNLDAARPKKATP